MNVIFLTVGRLRDIYASEIYSDLMRKFNNEGHNVYVVSPRERCFGIETHVDVQENTRILGVKTPNIQKANLIEKGISTLLLESLYKRAIKKYFKDVKFDLILYSTPPITFPNLIKWLKKENPNASTYLLLKDIFPQNAVDLGMFKKSSIIYKYFRKKERTLYAISDWIGCMSSANVQYVLTHNPEVNKDIVEVAPNSVDIANMEEIMVDRAEIRKKYNLPLDKKIFIYGGNLGKPQGIPFLIEALDADKDREDCHFVVVGDGVKYSDLENWMKEKNPKNVSLYKRLPIDEYDKLVCSCDVGLICLDYRFTIPNFPSRLLSYLKFKMPVLVATDAVCDMGRIAAENCFGCWCPSNNIEAFKETVDHMLQCDLKKMGHNAYQYLLKNYLVENTYKAIIKHNE